jgi:hypothetical protein
MAMELEKEYETYLREKPKLLADGKAGRFVLIFGDKIDSDWCCQPDALSVGYDKFWPKPFMVQQIQENERIHTI